MSLPAFVFIGSSIHRQNVDELPEQLMLPGRGSSPEASTAPHEDEEDASTNITLSTQVKLPYDHLIPHLRLHYTMDWNESIWSRLCSHATTLPGDYGNCDRVGLHISPVRFQSGPSILDPGFINAILGLFFPQLRELVLTGHISAIAPHNGWPLEYRYDIREITFSRCHGTPGAFLSHASSVGNRPQCIIFCQCKFAADTNTELLCGSIETVVFRGENVGIEFMLKDVLKRILGKREGILRNILFEDMPHDTMSFCMGIICHSVNSFHALYNWGAVGINLQGDADATETVLHFLRYMVPLQFIIPKENGVAFLTRLFAERHRDIESSLGDTAPYPRIFRVHLQGVSVPELQDDELKNIVKCEEFLGAMALKGIHNLDIRLLGANGKPCRPSFSDVWKVRRDQVQ